MFGLGAGNISKVEQLRIEQTKLTVQLPWGPTNSVGPASSEVGSLAEDGLCPNLRVKCLFVYIFYMIIPVHAVPISSYMCH